jgi:hypothetical protein
MNDPVNGRRLTELRVPGLLSSIRFWLGRSNRCTLGKDILECAESGRNKCRMGVGDASFSFLDRFSLFSPKCLRFSISCFNLWFSLVIDFSCLNVKTTYCLYCVSRFWSSITCCFCTRQTLCRNSINSD